MQALRSSRQRRGGFTIIEVVLVGFLTTMLAGLLVRTWAAYGHAATEVAARCELMQEADFAIASMAADLAGLATDLPNLDGKAAPLVGLRPWNGGLQLCFDGGTSPDGLPDWTSPDVVVTYAPPDSGQPGPLVRTVSTSVDMRIIAYHVRTIQFQPLNTPFVQIDLILSHPISNLVRSPAPGPLERTFTLIATQP